MEKGACSEALAHLKTALGYAEKLENPYEMGIIYRIYAQIKAGIYSACDNDISVQMHCPRTRHIITMRRAVCSGMYIPPWMNNIWMRSRKKFQKIKKPANQIRF